jgi:hypothetical protein
MEYALVDCGANGVVWGDDMLAVEGSERLVDVSGLAVAGHKINQLHIDTDTGIRYYTQGRSDCHLSSDVVAWHRQEYIVFPSNGIIRCRH